MCEISNTAGVAPLVIVPSNDLDHVAADNHCRKSINDRGMRIATEVHRDKRFICIFEDALERASFSLLEGIVNGFFGSLRTQGCYEIDHRNGHGWHTQRHAIKASLQFGNNQRQSPSSARRGWDNVNASRTSASQVAVNLVQYALV